MVRNYRQGHDVFVGQVVNGAKARNGGNVRTRAAVNKNALAFEHLISNSDLVWPYELRRSVEQVQVGTAVLHPFQQAVAKPLDDPVFLSDDPGQVDADISRANTPALGVFRIV